MPARKEVMHLYTVEHKTNRADRAWNIMHPKCAKKFHVPANYNIILGREVDNARATCTICKMENNPEEAQRERTAILALLKDSADRRAKYLRDNPPVSLEATVSNPVIASDQVSDQATQAPNQEVSQ